MDINRINSMQVGMYKSENVQENTVERNKKSKETESKPQGDKVNLSLDAQLHDIARRTAQEALDIRQEKVDSLKSQLENGSYEIDVRQLASSLLFEDSAIFRA